MLRNEATLFGGVTMRLTSTIIVAHRPDKRQVVGFPNINQRIHKLVHHFRGVMRSWCNAQALFTPCNCWIVYRLHVDIVMLHEVVRDLSAFLRVANLTQMQ